MKRETLWIVLLTVSAALLMAFYSGLQRPAVAANTIKERDYQLVTARLGDGGEALYVTDARTGVCAVFSFDPATRSVVLRQAAPIGSAFMRR